MTHEPSDKFLRVGTSSDETNEIHCISDNLSKQCEHRYVNYLRQGLRLTRDNNILCDVTIIVKGRRFQCHKVILSMFSGFFKSMFTSGMKECHESESELKSVNAETFEIILKYLYTGVLKGFVDLRELLTTSLYLQIKSLSDTCQEMLCSDLNLIRAIEFWRIADQHGNECEIMMHACQNWMLGNFNSYFSNDDCLTLSADEIIFLLSHDALSVTSEDDVCTFVLKWIQRDFINRKQYLNVIFKQVRLPLVKGPILKRVKRCIELCDSGELSKSLSDAEQYQRRLARQCYVNTIHTEPRRRSSMEKGIIIISGAKDSDAVDRCREVWFYSFQANKWHRLPKLPHMEHGFATCTFGRSTVCITGGAENSNCYKYHGGGRRNKWHSFENMIEERAGHCLIAIDKCIYAIGGVQMDYSEFLGRRTLASIEKFDTFTKHWELCGDLVFDVVDAAVSDIGNVLYIFPSCLYENTDIQSFDVSTSTVSVIKNRESFITFTCVGSDDEALVVMAENKNIYVKSFNPLEEDFIIVGQFTAEHKLRWFESVKWGPKLYILGVVAQTSESIIYEYNLQTKSSRELEDHLPYPLFEFGCHVITMKKEYFK